MGVAAFALFMIGIMAISIRSSWIGRFCARSSRLCKVRSVGHLFRHHLRPAFRRGGRVYLSLAFRFLPVSFLPVAHERQSKARVLFTP